MAVETPPAPVTVPDVHAAALRDAAVLDRSPWPRRIAWIVGVLAVLGIGVAIGSSGNFLLGKGFPDRWVIGVEDWFTGLDTWVIQNKRTAVIFTVFFNPVSNAIDSGVEGLIDALSRMTWLGLLVGASAFAGFLAGWRYAVLTAVGVSIFGLLGVWEASIETLALMTLSVAVALAIGIPLGLVAGRKPGVDRAIRPLLDAAQTIPAYSYLLPFVLFLGTGYPPALVATVIFALPPAVRLTSLGVSSIPSTTIEVADSFGTTSRQRLRRVQIPIAKPSIMLGVNQTIMMALGMVVIAAVVGAAGLGSEVLQALRQLNVGEALNGGVAIVAMAIVLDRVTNAWSQRERRRRGGATLRIGRREISRRMQLVGVLAVTVLAVVIGREVLRQQEWPEQLTFSLEDPTNAIIDWVQTNLGGVTNWIGEVLTDVFLDPFQELLLAEPWWIIAALAALAGWKVKGWRLALFCFICVLLLGMLGQWDLSMVTLSQVLVAVVVTLIFAIPIGILASRSDGFDAAIKPILDTMQTMPAFVYLVPVLLLFPIGTPVPAIIASMVYALPVGIRLTNLGIRQVPTAIVEAADSFGATGTQKLTKAQLPLARPSILLGVNQTIMMVLSVVIIGGMIGAGGLGFEALVALAKGRIGLGVVVGVSILLMALVLDRLTQAMGAAPRSLRGPVGTGGMFWTRARALVVRTTEETDSATVDMTARKGDA